MKLKNASNKIVKLGDYIVEPNGTVEVSKTFVDDLKKKVLDEAGYDRGRAAVALATLVEVKPKKTAKRAAKRKPSAKKTEESKKKSKPRFWESSDLKGSK